jgi:hypothetical protein
MLVMWIVRLDLEERIVVGGKDRCVGNRRRESGGHLELIVPLWKFVSGMVSVENYLKSSCIEFCTESMEYR